MTKKSERAPNVTPIHQAAADASDELEAVAEAAERSTKVIGLFIAIATLIAFVTGAVLWLVAYVGETTAHAIEQSAPRELFDAHVRQAEKTDERLEHKIDKIGEKTYDSPSEWRRATKDDEREE